MTDDADPPSQRARGRARRAEKAALREWHFEALAAGFTLQQIAEVRKVSVKTGWVESAAGVSTWNSFSWIQYSAQRGSMAPGS